MPFILISFSRKRDAAHLKVKDIFYKAISERRAAVDHEDDMLQTLIESTYKLVNSISLIFLTHHIYVVNSTKRFSFTLLPFVTQGWSSSG